MQIVDSCVDDGDGYPFAGERFSAFAGPDGRRVDEGHATRMIWHLGRQRVNR